MSSLARLVPLALVLVTATATAARGQMSPETQRIADMANAAVADAYRIARSAGVPTSCTIGGIAYSADVCATMRLTQQTLTDAQGIVNGDPAAMARADRLLRMLPMLEAQTSAYVAGQRTSQSIRRQELARYYSDAARAYDSWAVFDGRNGRADRVPYWVQRANDFRRAAVVMSRPRR
jgi:hypothetical protein